MAKIFYTERDIEDMARRGEMTLVVGDNVVLTDLAYESARRLHVELVQPHDTPPAAPIRRPPGRPARAATAAAECAAAAGFRAACASPRD